MGNLSKAEESDEETFDLTEIEGELMNEGEDFQQEHEVDPAKQTRSARVSSLVSSRLATFHHHLH